MIHSVGENTDFIGILSAFSPENPFACRIISLYNSYSPHLAFVDYWLISDENGNITGAAARNGSSFLLFLTDSTDLDEVSSFLRVSGAASILCDGKYKLNFSSVRTSEGVILSRNTLFVPIDNSLCIVQPDIRDAYYLIVRCADENFTPPAFEDFYVDVNHKLRHQTMRMYGIREKNRLVAVAMTVAESKDGAVLGALACDPDFRNRGYGSALIKYISNLLISENKTVFLHRAQNANVSFYHKLGFTQSGEWQEYYF